jgi:hypothetical protein
VRAVNQAQENAILAANEAFLFRQGVVLATDRVVVQAGAMGFVGGEIGKSINIIRSRTAA